MSLAAHSNVAASRFIDDPYLREQRQHYTMAKKALKNDNKALYEKLKTKLQGYPLYPYLEYREIMVQLDQLPYQRIDRFLERHQGSHLADELLKRWLQQLARRKDWRNYTRYYQSSLNSTALYCHYLWSQFKTGDKNIYPQITALWNVGKSQPAACNKVFDQWKKSGYLTPEIAWERHKKAITRGNHGLASYISRSMPKSMKRSAKLYRRINRLPKIIVDKSLFNEDTPLNRDIIAHGLRKYARSDPKAANSLWQQYRQQYTFSSDDQDRINLYTAIRLAKKGYIEHATELAVSHSGNPANINDPRLVTTVLRQLLKQQRWRDILVWIEQLPAAEKQSDQWRYWQARALAHTYAHNIKQHNTRQRIQSIYRELSANRSYYGFLAADRIGLDYAFTDKPATIGNRSMQEIKAIPALQRAFELFALGKMYTARHEWAYGVKNLSNEQHRAAAQLADEWGWNRKAIESMAAAKYWNDLDIRFPLVHTHWVDKASRKIPSTDNTLIYAIARQESTWAADALSPAGAVGLMQIIPKTARQTARRIGLSYSRKRLFQPEYNITIGSRYVDKLIRRYKGNRLLAVAAYNAGPNRVNRWLANSGQKLPYDVWIEVIPFKETRKYVKNVLYYKVIYDYRTGQSASLITQDEARQTL